MYCGLHFQFRRAHYHLGNILYNNMTINEYQQSKDLQILDVYVQNLNNRILTHLLTKQS
jgi:hypothetical protein